MRTSTTSESLPHKFITRIQRPLTLILAASLASAGQYVFPRDLDADLPLGGIAMRLERVFPHPESVLLAVFLLVTAGILFVLAWRADGPVQGKAVEQSVYGAPRVVPDAYFWMALAIALVLLAFLSIQLATGGYERWFVALFLAVLLLSALAWLRQDRLSGVEVRIPLSAWEVAAVLIIAMSYAGLMSHDLDNWYYSAIGDEYAFFFLAKDIAEGYDVNLFSAEDGVYRQHVVASSAYQAIFLRVLGPTNFNWKLAGLFSVLLTMPFIYLLVRELFDRSTALLSTLFFASSHYVFAYVHIGYFNVLPIFPTVAAFACFILGVRRQSSLCMFLAGVFAGMGFYTFFSSRAAIVVMALWFLTIPGWHRRWRTSLAVSSGFLATVLPLFATSKLYVIEEMLRQSALSYDESIVGSRLDRILENVPRTAFAFNYNSNALHYVSGSLADACTAGLFVVGAVYAVSRLGDWRYRFLVLWVVFAFVAAGLLSPYPQVSISRLSYLVPIVAVLAAVALTGFLRGLSEGLPRYCRFPAYALGAFAVLSVVLGLNVDRFWSVTPSRIPTTAESVAMRAIFSSRCSHDGGARFVIARQPEPLFKPAIDSYRLGSRAPVLLKPTELLNLAGIDEESVACAVIMGDSFTREQVADTLLRLWPSMSIEMETDHSGRVSVSVVTHGSATSSRER